MEFSLSLKFREYFRKMTGDEPNPSTEKTVPEMRVLFRDEMPSFFPSTSAAPSDMRISEMNRFLWKCFRRSGALFCRLANPAVKVFKMTRGVVPCMESIP